MTEMDNKSYAYRSKNSIELRLYKELESPEA